jgi:hypothetical protein
MTRTQYHGTTVCSTPPSSENRRLIPYPLSESPGAILRLGGHKCSRFLARLYIWANWDVEELVALKDKILAEPGILKMGLQGIDPIYPTYFADIAEMRKNEKAQV